MLINIIAGAYLLMLAAPFGIMLWGFIDAMRNDASRSYFWGDDCE